jgi:hypothetical protein
MDITVYLPDDLGTWAKRQSLPLSRMLRAAVIRRRNAMQEGQGAMTSFEMPRTRTRTETVPAHEVLLVFNGDREALAFGEWLDDEGEEAFESWLAAKTT